MKIVGMTDIGNKRSINEDYFLIDNESYVFVIADGIGGYSSGEIASKMVCEEFIGRLRNLSFPMDNEYFAGEVSRICYEVNDIVSNYARANENSASMGATLAAIKIFYNQVYIVNVGDSPIFGFNDEYHELSFRHTVKNKYPHLVEHLESDDKKNQVTSAFGMDYLTDIHTKIIGIQDFKKLLISTDGLTDMITMQEITSIINNNDAENSSRILIETAKQNGGLDNITLICIDIEG